MTAKALRFNFRDHPAHKRIHTVHDPELLAFSHSSDNSLEKLEKHSSVRSVCSSPLPKVARLEEHEGLYNATQQKSESSGDEVILPSAELLDKVPNELPQKQKSLLNDNNYKVFERHTQENFWKPKDCEKNGSSAPSAKSVSAQGNNDIYKEHGERRPFIRRDYCVNNSDLSELRGMLRRDEISEIKFTNCSTSHSKKLDEGDEEKYRVPKVTINFTKSFKDLKSLINFVFKLCEVETLCLMYNYMDDKNIEALEQTLSSKQNGNFKNLDVSYNKKITKEGFKKIGKMMREKGISALKAVDCKIDHEKLAGLIEGVQDRKLNELDLSRNKELTTNANREMTTKGIELLGNLVANKSVDTLKLVGCQLKKDHMIAFQEQLPDFKNEMLLRELDVGYNPTLDPDSYSTFGKCVRVCGVTALHLKGNKICHNHLKALKYSMEEHQMESLNVGDNFYLSGGLPELAGIVRENKVQKLFMTDCAFSADNLEQFRNSLKGWKGKLFY